MHIYPINKHELEVPIYEMIGELSESELQSRRHTLRGLSGISFAWCEPSHVLSCNIPADRSFIWRQASSTSHAWKRFVRLMLIIPLELSWAKNGRASVN